MKILLISDNTSGGAGTVCRRLYEALSGNSVKGCQLPVHGREEYSGSQLGADGGKTEWDPRTNNPSTRSSKGGNGTGRSPHLASHRREHDNLSTSGCELSARWLAMSGEANCGADIAKNWPGLVGEIVKRLAFRCAPSEADRLHFSNRWKTWGLKNDILKYIKRYAPDVISLHNIHLASFRLFERIPKHIKIVWTLHDMWPLTGYCVYSYDCEKYLTGCKGECPQWGKWGEAAYSPEVEWRRRQRSIEQRAGTLSVIGDRLSVRSKTVDSSQLTRDLTTQQQDNLTTRQSGNLTFVAPSEWLAECARKRFAGSISVEDNQSSA